MKRPNKRTGQALIEYSILIIVVLGVFLAMVNYTKRGLQGRWKASVDDLGDQYDPRTANTFVNYATTSSANTAISMVPASGGSWTQRVDTTNSVETKIGQTTIGAVFAN
ncbi:MAG: hypothetical protein WCH62_06045 [Candidatus Omnitrophota bacterium]